MLSWLLQDRSVFPTHLGVVRLSGTGYDSIFLGACKPVTDGQQNSSKMWVTPAGVMLCLDRHLADLLGYTAVELIGKPLVELSTKEDDSLQK